MRKYLLPFLFFCLSSHSASSQSGSPNIILILVDDLGYSDLASYGNKHIKTPNIDALGTKGTRFTQALVTSPICAPSRMGIITGRYQQRFGGEYMLYDKFAPAVKKNIRKHLFSGKKKPEGITTLKPDYLLIRSGYNTDLPKTETTIAQLLKQKGYATGYVGKWNLSSTVDVFPDQYGFDYSYYFNGALSRYVDETADNSPYVNMHLPWSFSEIPAWAPRFGSTAIREGHTVVKDTGYLSFSFAEKGIEFIERNKTKPFFLTLSFNAPHDPFQVPKTNFDRIEGVTDSVKRVYYGMIEALDDAVGTLMQKLDKEGLTQNCLVFFISDNGGATYTRATDNAPLRGGKATHFEGGLEVPFFVQYPAALRGGQVYEKPVSSLDIFSTVAAVTNSILPADRPYDGVNLLSMLPSGSAVTHDFFFWRSGYSKAYRKGDWKLYINEKNKITWLFNLAEDREEKNNLAAKYPEKLKELTDDLKEWEKKNTVAPLWPSSADLLIDVGGKWFRFPS
ncbi:MAG: sulfatase-like hydrolase/transferase [Chitinophagaceae bacterium]|nr:sulfatase-like hydrolase/transferase [Chitinophagaceae bacterium]